jgi:hypothetical protein
VPCSISSSGRSASGTISQCRARGRAGKTGRALRNTSSRTRSLVTSDRRVPNALRQKTCEERSEPQWLCHLNAGSRSLSLSALGWSIGLASACCSAVRLSASDGINQIPRSRCARCCAVAQPLCRACPTGRRHSGTHVGDHAGDQSSRRRVAPAASQRVRAAVQLIAENRSALYLCN